MAILARVFRFGTSVPSERIRNLPGSVATFTLGASGDANFTILQAGDQIFQFDVDFQRGSTETITVSNGKAYLAIALDFQIDGELTASSPVNSIGISANASTGGTLTYTVERSKLRSLRLRCRCTRPR